MTQDKKNVDTRQSLKVVTTNSFITAKGLPELTLKARKLLLIAIGQCQLKDTDFYEYSITIQEFANLMGIDSSHVYETADSITDELIKAIIRIDFGQDEGFKKVPLFAECEYKSGVITFQLNQKMTQTLLGLRGDFTQPLLNDFMKMKSPYSMQIWHLMQREMKSKKPGVSNTIEFDLSLEELRAVTGTEDKLLTIGNFKNRILNKAIREIESNCGVRIQYENIKNGRFVTGFHFSAISTFHVDIAKIDPETIAKIEAFKQRKGEI